MAKKKYVYFFGDGKAEGKGDWKDLLGGKGAGLAEMTNLGIPVPAGFTITTKACNEFYLNKKRYPEGMWDEVIKNLRKVEKAMGQRFGDTDNPLLVSVRSGAKFSMPGMMDTVLNIGLNKATVKGLAKRSSNERFALDSYRRFITMFGDIVMGIERKCFEKIMDEVKAEEGVKHDAELDRDALSRLIVSYKELVKKETGRTFPDDPLKQLKMSIDAVFNSWHGQRAVTYRNLNKISHNLGTGVNVQTMVFGNMGETSGTGVAFTRDPSTGEKRFFGECMLNAQGEDVVAGIRTPLPIEALKEKTPKAYKDLMGIYKKLERHYRDMLDIEFTIQEGKLYMLQTRVGKRTAAASIRIAVEMVKERLINKNTAIMRVNPEQIDQLLHPMVDSKAKVNIIANGLPASPGASVGKVVFTAEEVEKKAEDGEKVILVRTETSPEDIGGMHAAQGILTSRGGMTSHAAVVARGMGKCCVAGCESLNIDEEKMFFRVRDVTVKEGDYITLNGSTGEVILGKTDLIKPKFGDEFKTLMSWVDEVRNLKVRTNADTPLDAKVAREFGAEGIGLCRTEHMFFETNRIKAVREMIMSDDITGRKNALAKLISMQKKDFIGIFKEMKGLPVTIRLLDPPLHEFLPKTKEEISDMSKEMGISVEELMIKNRSLQEFNPMLGHRGCRLGVTYPEIYEMQAQAIFEAACELTKKRYTIIPEIMIPLVADVKELDMMKDIVNRVAKDVMARYKTNKLKYLVGTMIELPRAAITADKIGEIADFFSFGTNDLTQMTYGLSRDDAGKFLPYYVENRILPHDPFISLDQEGVGELVKIGVKKGRRSKKGLKIGVCGEHGGDPNSVKFFHQIGLDYVSCSPYRVPIARLAAAHAVLEEREG
ncbi:MAG: pyruvate, phosphate dikinase [Nitrospirota bacterium]